MGATNCPETPRQRMIGMMYLVLTALLALNVSKDILDAFATVDETLIRSTENVHSAINTQYTWFGIQKDLLGEAKMGNAVQNTAIVQKKSDELVGYINQLKKDLIFVIDGDSTFKDKKDGQIKLKTLRELEGKDNTDKPSDFLINKKKAGELQQKIIEYKKNMLDLEPNQDKRKELENTLGLDVEKKIPNKNNGNTEEDWATYNFNGTIAAAAITLLNKTIGEVRNAEAVMLNHIKLSIDANDFKFDKVEGRTIPVSQMVFTGSNYTADVIVAAFDTKQTPEVYYGMGRDTAAEADIPNLTIVPSENGVGKLSIPAGTVGEKKYAGVIKVKAPDGSNKFYSFKDKFVTAAPTATVVCEYSMIIYAGIPNPVSVSAPVSADKLRIDFGGLPNTKSGDNKYQVTPPVSLIGKYIKISVSSVDNGKTTNLGSFDYKIVRVPDPQFLVGGSANMNQTVSDIKSKPFVQSKMPDDFAVKDLRWTIRSYDVLLSLPNGQTLPLKSTGPNLPADVVSKVVSGSKLVIYNMAAQTPSGQSLSNPQSIVVNVR